MDNTIFNLEDISRKVYDELKLTNNFALNEIDIVVKELSKSINLFVDLDASISLTKKVLNLMNIYAIAQVSGKYKYFNTSDAFVRYCIDRGIYE